MEKFRDSVDPLLTDLEAGGDVPAQPVSAPGLFARLLGRSPSPAPRSDTHAEAVADKLRQLAAAAADGYALSLRRVERLLPELELEPIACTGQPFDPETMEVVEVVGDSGQTTGTVVEELRPGYWWRGAVFRYAQVKVAR
jgi:molecular chaperone GrpE